MPINTPVPLLPRYSGVDPDVQAWSEALCRVLEQWMRTQSSPGGGGRWTVTNLTASRSLDASGATAAQVREALATLITDAIAAGTIAR